MVAVFRECWRVLRDDGTLWLNVGNSYAGGGRGGNGPKRSENWQPEYAHPEWGSMKPKDLVGIPWRLAFALQQPYQVPTCVKSEIDKAWLAAIFDGEGSIGIRRFSSYRKELQQVYQDGFVIYTSVTNNDTELLERCIEVTGYGKATLKQSADSTDKRGIVSRRDSFGWRLDGNKAVDVIRSIYPYLIIKRKQACIAYTLDDLNKNGHGSRAVPKEIQDKKAYLKELAHRCNQREKIDLPDWIKEPKPEIQPGWYLRSDIIWSKPNPMPESVTDRPTKSHEYLFLLAKQEKYYYDAEAIKEDQNGNAHSKGTKLHPPIEDAGIGHKDWHKYTPAVDLPNGRNRRTVWTISTAPYKGAHFATFPPALVEPCIKAGTSERGACPKCGKGWRRVVEIKQIKLDNRETSGKITGGTSLESGAGNKNGGFHELPRTRKESNTINWQPACACDAGDPIPCLVFDPFVGSGTTVKVAYDLGRRGVGLDLSLDYLDEQARKRIHNGHTARLF